MSKGTQARLETLRQLAASEGIPLDCIDRLALSPARVARLLDVSPATIQRELDDGHLGSTSVRGARRISVVELVDYLDRNRRLGTRRRSPRQASVDAILGSSHV